MFISLAQHLALMAAERQRYDALLEHYHALKAAGAEPANIQRAPLEKKPTDRVMEVIADIAGSNATLRKQLGAYARRERANKTDDDEIVNTLLHWTDEDDA